MSRLQELIRELCPQGVEYRKLGDYITIYTGEQFNKRDMSDNGRYPVINGGMEPSGFSENFNETENTITISQGGASAGFVNWIDCKFWAGAHCYVVKPSGNAVQNRFLYFLLKNKEKLLMQSKHGAGIPALGREKINKLLIPLPPLPVQEEIVRILDRFTNLAAELQARREQYEYYRNKLLTFDKTEGGTQGVTWMRMSEIGTFARGNGLQKKDFTERGVPCIHYGEIYTYYGTFATKTKSFVSNETAKKCKKAHTGDLIIASTSENVEDVGKTVAWLGKENIAISNHSFIFSHNQNPVYLSYLFQTEQFAKYKKTKAVGVKVIDIPQKALEDFVIPLPPLPVQQRIVSILDKFEALANDLAEGLPAEIAAVQEQYEYYRNQLLSFKRKEHETV